MFYTDIQSYLFFEGFYEEKVGTNFSMFVIYATRYTPVQASVGQSVTFSGSGFSVA